MALSQENSARDLGVSFVTTNRWEYDKAKAQVDRFFTRIVQQGKLKGFEGGP